MDLKPSAGTAKVLGLEDIKADELPTCAYIMIGNQCRGECLFCSQGVKSKSKNFLSRITWRPHPPEEVLRALKDKYLQGEIKRVCLQVVQERDAYNHTLELVKKIRDLCDIPICVSINGVAREEMETLLDCGVEHVAFSIDCATKELYKKIKGKDWHEEWNLFMQINNSYPRRIVVHLIVGMGETARDIVDLLKKFNSLHIPVSLFAFTPLAGTPMSGLPQPSLSYYRKIQTAYFLIRNNLSTYNQREVFFFDNKGNIFFNPHMKEYIISKVPGHAFRTFGCKDCNRPLYNEKPGMVPYNYPRPLKEEETVSAIDLLFEREENI